MTAEKMVMLRFENESHRLGALSQRDRASEFTGLAGLVDEVVADVEGRQKHAAVCEKG
jgi:hypothetical protein